MYRSKYSQHLMLNRQIASKYEGVSIILLSGTQPHLKNAKTKNWSYFDCVEGMSDNDSSATYEK